MRKSIYRSKLFVYGTLQRKQGLHRCMEGATFIGEVKTLPMFTLHSMVAYPALADGGDTAVEGELYLVHDEMFHLLDRVEGVPHLYTRQRVYIPGHGRAFVYIMRDVRDLRVIPNGSWKNRPLFEDCSKGCGKPAPITSSYRQSVCDDCSDWKTIAKTITFNKNWVRTKEKDIWRKCESCHDMTHFIGIADHGYWLCDFCEEMRELGMLNSFV